MATRPGKAGGAQLAFWPITVPGLRPDPGTQAGPATAPGQPGHMTGPDQPPRREPRKRQFQRERLLHGPGRPAHSGQAVRCLEQDSSSPHAMGPARAAPRRALAIYSSRHGRRDLRKRPRRAGTLIFGVHARQRLPPATPASCAGRSASCRPPRFPREFDHLHYTPAFEAADRITRSHHRRSGKGLQAGIGRPSDSPPGLAPSARGHARAPAAIWRQRTRGRDGCRA
jgi:hypothetical protein